MWCSVIFQLLKIILLCWIETLYLFDATECHLVDSWNMYLIGSIGIFSRWRNQMEACDSTFGCRQVNILEFVANPPAILSPSFQKLCKNLMWRKSHTRLVQLTENCCLMYFTNMSTSEPYVIVIQTRTICFYEDCEITRNACFSLISSISIYWFFTKKFSRLTFVKCRCEKI